jgi:YHS domain-containing protein
MLRYLFLEVVLPLLAFLLLRSVIGSIFQTARNVGRRETATPPQQPNVVAGGELKKDPVCGTYVSAALSVTRTVNGQVLHFCSPECRDKYHAA